MIISPLRYAGSKRKLYNYLERIFICNDLQPRVVVEPFVGGGSVFINFLSRHRKSTAIIADKDELVYSFWKVLFADPIYLTNFVKKVRVNLRNFDKYRYISSNPAGFDRKKLAEACLFLNRTSFSGILNDSAGPLGGRAQRSIYKLDCRFGRANLIKKIEIVSAFRKRVKVLPFGWEKTLKYAAGRKNDGACMLYYLDPPFYKKADQLYRYSFDSISHEKLRNQLVKLKQPWILSYDRVTEIQKLYSSFRKINVSMPYSINSPAKRLEKELVITPLKLPRIKNEEQKNVYGKF